MSLDQLMAGQQDSRVFVGERPQHSCTIPDRRLVSALDMRSPMGVQQQSPTSYKHSSCRMRSLPMLGSVRLSSSTVVGLCTSVFPMFIEPHPPVLPGTDWLPGANHRAQGPRLRKNPSVDSTKVNLGFTTGTTRLVLDCEEVVHDIGQVPRADRGTDRPNALLPSQARLLPAPLCTLQHSGARQPTRLSSRAVVKQALQFTTRHNYT
jgi:hypothetical protein